MIYAKNLKQLREDNDKTQDVISDLLDIQRGVYSQYETEYKIMPIKHLITICNFYKVSLDYVFDFTDMLSYQNEQLDIDINKMTKRLKEFRKENDITQVELAEVLNIGNGTYADYERGRYIISTHALYTICKKYNISADYLLGKTDEPKYLK